MSKIPLIDVKSQFAELVPEIERRFREVVESGQYIRGENYWAFQEEAAAYLGVKRSVGVANGTDAIVIALDAMQIGPGDEVVCPAFTFYATAESIARRGATPVFADVDPDHWCLDPAEFGSLVTPRTRAVIPVHVYGHPCEMNAICDIAREHGLAVIEDAAEAIGARYRDQPVGGLGDVGIFSFYGNKLITTGEGGALVTDDPDLAQRIRVLRDHAMDPVRRYWHGEIGFNYRITNVQAAIGVAQLERFHDLLGWKRAIAGRYRAGLEDIPALRPQEEASWAESAWWMFTVRVSPELGIDRDRLAVALASGGIDSRPTFAPIHEMPPYRTGAVLPITDAIAREGLTLPSGAGLTEDEQEQVIARVRDACCQ